MSRSRTCVEVLRNCAIAKMRKFAIAQRWRAVTRMAAATAATILALQPAAASDYVDTEAIFHARAIQEAWTTLADHIREGSSAAVSWTGTRPPASTGWLAGWTARGLGALYCDSVLLVHVTTASMKGVGTNLGAVQLAPHLEAKAGARDVPPLHWLESGRAEGILGRDGVALPACMGATPSGRPALAGFVVDPFTVTTNQVTFEHQARACPAGSHGTGQTWVREVTQKLNGRGNPVGAPTTGAWSLLVDHCRPDTVSWEYFRQPCTFTPGAPHVGTLTGDAVWRRQKSVTAAGTSYGAPQFVSTTCWTNPNPAPPVPTVTTSTSTQTRSLSCGAGYTGSRTQRRTLSWRHLKWPWDAVATVQRVSQTNWATSSNTCRRIPPPPPAACPPGQIGTPPNCTTPVKPPPAKCPAGQVGTPPNCRTPVTPPAQCPAGQVGTPPNCKTPTSPPPAKCPAGQVGTPPNCTTPPKPCVDRDKGGGCPGSGSNNSGRGRGGGIGGGWDTDGDGKADVATLGEVEQADRKNANFIQGHTPIGRDRGNSRGDRGDRDPPGGEKGSGDRGR